MNASFAVDIAPAGGTLWPWFALAVVVFLAGVLIAIRANRIPSTSTRIAVAIAAAATIIAGVGIGTWAGIRADRDAALDVKTQMNLETQHDLVVSGDVTRQLRELAAEQDLLRTIEFSAATTADLDLRCTAKVIDSGPALQLSCE